MFSVVSHGSRKGIVLRAGILILAIAIADWCVDPEIPLEFLCVFPVVLLGGALSRWQLGLAAGLCTFLAEMFVGHRWLSRAQATAARDILVFTAFFSMGLFVSELTRNRKAALLHVNELRNETRLRSEAEEQLKVLVESSPAAIITMDSNNRLILANEAAYRVFDVPRAHWSVEMSVTIFRCWRMFVIRKVSDPCVP